VRLHEFYVAGIRDDVFIVVGPRRVQARSLRNGNAVWITSDELLSRGATIAGRGVFGADRFLIPTSTDELIEISLQDGQVLNRRQVRFPLGNLVAVGGELISQNSTTLSVAYGEAALRPRVDEILKRDPDDFTALVRKAELLIEDDQRREALSLLDRARQLQPDNDEVLMLSVTAMLGTLRADPMSDDVDLATLESLIDRPEQQAELMVLRIEGLLAAIENDPDDDDADQRQTAMRLLRDFSSLLLREPSLRDAQNIVLPKLDRDLELGNWISARVADVCRDADATTRAKLSSVISEHLKDLTYRETGWMQQAVRHFAPLKEADSLRAALSERHLSLDDPLAAERIALGEGLATDEMIKTLPLELLTSLGEVYQSVRWAADVQAIENERLKRLDSMDSNDALAETDSFDVEKDTDTVNRNRQLENELRDLGLITASQWRDPNAWPSDVTLQWQSSRSPARAHPFTDRRYDNVQTTLGRSLLGWQVMRDSSGPLTLINPHGIGKMIGIRGWSQRSGTHREIIVSGGVMIVMTTSELIAIDLFQVLGPVNQPAIRWRRPHVGDGSEIAKRTSVPSPISNQVYRYRMNSVAANAAGGELRLGPVMTDRVYMMNGTELLCLDLLTGDVNWRTHDFLPGGVIVANADQVAIVSDRNQTITVLDARDGRRLESRPRRMETILASTPSHVLALTRLKTMRGWETQRPGTIASMLGTDADSSLSDTDSLAAPVWLECFDPLTGEKQITTWTSSSNVGIPETKTCHGYVEDGQFLTLIEDDGHVRVWDLIAGQSVADVNVTLTGRVDDFATMRLHDQLLLMPRTRSATRPQPAVGGSAAVHPLSQLHAISCPDQPEERLAIPGQHLWSRSFEKAFACTLTHPHMTPMIMINRGWPYTTSGRVTNRREMDVLALNVSDGTTLDSVEGKQVRASDNSLDTWIKLIAGRNEVRVDMQGEALTYQFAEPQRSKGDEPTTDSVDPEPTAAGDESS
ncbi:MAG: PQQ-binding-like beta-propeller repeat protein, partial [Planctomycetota bacterium]